MIQRPEPLRRRSGVPWLVVWPLLLVVVVAAAVAGRAGQEPARAGPQREAPAAVAPGSVAPASPSVSRAPAGPSSSRVPRDRARALVGATAVRVAPGPMAVAAGHGLVWVASRSDSVVRGLDPDTGRVLVRVAAGDADLGPPLRGFEGPRPVLAVAGGSVWAAALPDPTVVVRVDVASSRLAPRVAVGAGVVGALGDERALWLLTERPSLVRVDPATSEITADVPVPGSATWAALGETSLWVSAEDRVLRLDPVEGTVLGEVRGGGGPIGIRDGTVWALSPGATGAILVAIDEATGRVLRRVDVATSGDAGIAWSLPTLEPTRLSDEATRFMPRDGRFVHVGEVTWLVRPDLGEAWRIVRR